MLRAFTAACWAFVSFVRWRLATDLDRDEEELDATAKRYATAERPSVDDELLIARLRERIGRKKRQLSLARSTMDQVEEGPNV